MVLGIQIAGFLFGLFFLYYSFINYKKKEFTAKEFAFWIAAWAAFIVIAIFPAVLDPIVEYGGFFRALDVLIVTGFLFLITAAFYTYTLTRKTQKQVESIVRAVALMKRKR
jgi:hypothetical protein